ncbi:MAG: sigma 54-interacting transcriptional regulator [Myxococcota bacterium]
MSSSDLETIRLADRPATRAVCLRLVVVAEGYHSTHSLADGAALVIGRGEDADIRVEDRSMSRRHARVLVGPVPRIEDLESANGVRVRDRKLAVGEKAELVVGEVAELGSTLVFVQPEVPAAVGEWRLAPHQRFSERLAELCGARARPFALVRLHAAGVGAAEVQKALAQATDGEDLAASYGPGEYELLLPAESETEAARRVETVVAALEAAGAQVRSGKAIFPTDGDSAEALLGAASSLHTRPGRTPFVVRDDAMSHLHQLVERIAPSNINVLVLGETGVGKEVLSAELHRRSHRADKPFLRLNCAALAETLLESELFGHEKGAFTGAVKTKQGLLETARGGTVLLDEVGELPASLQAKLLRVLEERQVMRVGALKPEAIDARFVFSTNRDLEAEVARGAFRQDLYYRINGISLVIPPLRERVGEIEELALGFLSEAAKKDGLGAPPSLSVEALEALRRYPWPGNIRELRNVMERAVLLCTEGVVRPEHLGLGGSRPSGGAPVVSPPPAVEPTAVGLRSERDAAEKKAILDALDKCGGNQTQAAKLLGISRRTLVSRVQSYGLTRPRKPKS